MYTGKADWTLIAEVKNNSKIQIPIIGNGDITSAQKAKMLLDQSGVDALMIGRGAIGRPWLFQEVKHYLGTGELLKSPTVSEVVEVLREQIKINMEWLDNEYTCILMMRRHFAKYFPGLPDFRELKIELLRAETGTEVDEILNKIVDIYGSFQLEDNNIKL